MTDGSPRAKKPQKVLHWIEQPTDKTPDGMRYDVIELDDIQWAIRRNGQSISFHVFSDSLRRVWKQLTGQDLPIDLPEKRS